MLLGLGAFCEHAFADHSVLHFASAEQSANFVVTPLGGLLQRTSAELDANFTQTTENILLVNDTSASVSLEFEQTTDGGLLLSGVSSSDLNFTKTSIGDILFVTITPEDNETYTEITPTGTETYTEITPTGTETYPEIN